MAAQSCTACGRRLRGVDVAEFSEARGILFHADCVERLGVDGARALARSIAGKRAPVDSVALHSLLWTLDRIAVGCVPTYKAGERAGERVGPAKRATYADINRWALEAARLAWSLDPETAREVMPADF